MNLQLKGVNVPDANLADFKDKVCFLKFLGTWCPPCRAEFPSIQKLYDSKKDKVQFVLIAMQDQEASGKRNFWQKINTQHQFIWLTSSYCRKNASQSLSLLLILSEKMAEF